MERMIKSGIPGFQYKILTGNKIFYKCNPEINLECDHKKCFYNGTGPCEFTSKKEYALLIKEKKEKKC